MNHLSRLYIVIHVFSLAWKCSQKLIILYKHWHCLSISRAAFAQSQPRLSMKLLWKERILAERIGKKAKLFFLVTRNAFFLYTFKGAIWGAFFAKLVVLYTQLGAYGLICIFIANTFFHSSYIGKHGQKFLFHHYRCARFQRYERTFKTKKLPTKISENVVSGVKNSGCYIWKRLSKEWLHVHMQKNHNQDYNNVWKTSVIWKSLSFVKN